MKTRDGLLILLFGIGAVVALQVPTLFDLPVWVGLIAILAWMLLLLPLFFRSRRRLTSLPPALARVVVPRARHGAIGRDQ